MQRKKTSPLRKQKLYKLQAGKFYNKLVLYPEKQALFRLSLPPCGLFTFSASSGFPRHLYVASKPLLSPPKYHTLSFGLLYKIPLLSGMPFACFISDAESSHWQHCEYVCLLAQSLAQSVT